MRTAIGYRSWPGSAMATLPLRSKQTPAGLCCSLPAIQLHRDPAQRSNSAGADFFAERGHSDQVTRRKYETGCVRSLNRTIRLGEALLPDLCEGASSHHKSQALHPEPSQLNSRVGYAFVRTLAKHIQLPAQFRHITFHQPPLLTTATNCCQQCRTLTSIASLHD